MSTHKSTARKRADKVVLADPESLVRFAELLKLRSLAASTQVGYVNSRVVKFSADGRYQFEWGTKGNGPGAFTVPHGLTVDRDGRVYVADRRNDRVQVFSADGRFLELWAERAMGRPYGLRVGPDGLFYVSDGGEQPQSPPHRSGVAVLDRSGRVVTTFGRWGNQDGQFMMAHAIAVAPGGEIYVSDINGQRVQKLRWTDQR